MYAVLFIIVLLHGEHLTAYPAQQYHLATQQQKRIALVSLATLPMRNRCQLQRIRETDAPNIVEAIADIVEERVRVFSAVV